jgi:hypothetical protein
MPEDAFIRMMQHGFASDNRIHTEVPGTIFTEGYIYKWQAYVREDPNVAPLLLFSLFVIRGLFSINTVRTCCNNEG